VAREGHHRRPLSHPSNQPSERITALPEGAPRRTSDNASRSRTKSAKVRPGDLNL
jgi:hypothetical protein